MLTLKKVKELVEAPSHAKRTPSPRMLFEEGIVLLRREFDHGSHLTVYNSGYVLFSAGKRNTVFHIHDCCGDYAYDAAEGKGDVIEEEYFENCEWHIRALFEGERKMEDNQAKCEDAGRSNVCVSYHALSEDWSEVADRTILLSVISMLETPAFCFISCRMVCFPCGALLFCSKNFLIAFCNACSVSLAAPFPTLTDRAIVFWVTSSCKVSTPFPVNCGYAHLLP